MDTIVIFVIPATTLVLGFFLGMHRKSRASELELQKREIDFLKEIAEADFISPRMALHKALSLLRWYKEEEKRGNQVGVFDPTKKVFRNISFETQLE
jgi:hypothetical protein